MMGLPLVYVDVLKIEAGWLKNKIYNTRGKKSRCKHQNKLSLDRSIQYMYDKPTDDDDGPTNPTDQPTNEAS